MSQERRQLLTGPAISTSNFQKGLHESIRTQQHFSLTFVQGFE